MADRTVCAQQRIKGTLRKWQERQRYDYHGNHTPRLQTVMRRQSIERLRTNSFTLKHRKKGMFQKRDYNLKELTPLQNGRNPVGMLMVIGMAEKKKKNIVYILIQPTVSVNPGPLSHTSPSKPGAQKKKV